MNHEDAVPIGDEQWLARQRQEAQTGGIARGHPHRLAFDCIHILTEEFRSARRPVSKRRSRISLLSSVHVIFLRHFVKRGESMTGASRAPHSIEPMRSTQGNELKPGPKVGVSQSCLL